MKNVKTRELLLPISKRRKGNKLKSIGGVTIHNTGNASKGADADANARYQKNSCNDAANGWHWTVDEDEAVLSIPENEIAEHSGKRLGNDTTVGIEICENSDGDLLGATDNGAWLAAQVLLRQGFLSAQPGKNIYRHKDWSGKDCPRQINAGKPYDWNTFVAKVNQYMQEYEDSDGTVVQPIQPDPAPSSPVQSTSPLPDGILYYRAKTNQKAYFRSAPNGLGTIVRTLQPNTQLKYRGDAGNSYWAVTEVSNGKKGYVCGRLTVPDYLPKSDGIKALQERLGVTADGIYGKKTADAVGAFQKSKKLTVDCIYGPNTKKALESK